ncbi:MAG: hypothetical protein ACOCRO_05895 [Halanaerobiales bacterium]
MAEEKLSKVQRDVLSLNKRVLVRGVLKHSVNVYDEDSLQDGLEFIIPSDLWSNQEDFIYSNIYRGKNIGIEPLNTTIYKYFIMVYTVYTEDEDDEVYFYYSTKDFSLVKILYFKESDTLETIWQ